MLIITFHPVLWYGCRSRSIKNQIKTFDDIKELSILSFRLIIYVNKMVSNWKTPMAAPGHRNACEMTHDTERGPLALSEHCVCFSPFLIFFLCPQMDTSSPAMLGNTGGRSQLAGRPHHLLWTQIGRTDDLRGGMHFVSSFHRCASNQAVDDAPSLAGWLVGWLSVRRRQHRPRHQKLAHR